MKIKTEFTFDAAHRLVGHKGLCQQLHGHMWRVEVEIEGKDLDDIGIMWDFATVKLIRDTLDHKTILKMCDENEELIKTIKSVCGKDSLFLMHYNPTAENLAQHIYDVLQMDSKNLKFKIRVWESPKSYAEVKYESM